MHIHTCTICVHAFSSDSHGMCLRYKYGIINPVCSQSEISNIV